MTFMLQKLRNSNFVAIVLAARGTLLICCLLLFCYLLFSTLTNTFLIPTNDLLGDVASILKGELWRVITSTVYFSEWTPLNKTVLIVLVLCPFIEWKIGSPALVMSFFASSWIGILLFCFGLGGVIRSTVGINTYVYAFYGGTLSVYALFPLAVLAFLIKKPAFSLLAKCVLVGGLLLYFTVGFWPKSDTPEPAVIVQISQLCGVLSGLFCALIVVALRNWKKVSFFSAKPSN